MQMVQPSSKAQIAHLKVHDGQVVMWTTTSQSQLHEPGVPQAYSQ